MCRLFLLVSKVKKEKRKHGDCLLSFHRLESLFVGCTLATSSSFRISFTLPVPLHTIVAGSLYTYIIYHHHITMYTLLATNKLVKVVCLHR
jgi:hypothetical protein